MNKKIFILILVAILLVGCFNESKEEDNKKEEKIMTIDDKVEETLKSMTLDEKIGQMIMIFYNAQEMDNTLKSAIEEVNPGGFILFGNNITTYEKTLKLVKDIKNLSKIPMFIGIDEEGGNVQRLLQLKDYDITDIPYMSKVGEKNDLELTYNVGKVLAEELRVFGINMDFAPVIDVLTNKNNKVIGKRAFGNSPELVSKNGQKLADGLMDNGIIPVFKHFPGHGNTSVDSHSDLPVVEKTKEELLESDLIPFIDAINNDAKVIMVGHLAVPSITNDNTPASLSKELITNFLKKELNYNGLVVTDALNMGALTNYYSEDEICGEAVKAGVDVLLMPNGSRKCLTSVKNEIKNGDVTENMIDESVRKILKLKYENIIDNYDEYLSVDYLGSEEHKNIVNFEK